MHSIQFHITMINDFRKSPLENRWVRSPEYCSCESFIIHSPEGGDASISIEPSKITCKNKK
jgi:hypothetical protein